MSSPRANRIPHGQMEKVQKPQRSSAVETGRRGQAGAAGHAPCTCTCTSTEQTMWASPASGRQRDHEIYLAHCQRNGSDDHVSFGTFRALTIVDNTNLRSSINHHRCRGPSTTGSREPSSHRGLTRRPRRFSPAGALQLVLGCPRISTELGPTRAGDAGISRGVPNRVPRVAENISFFSQPATLQLGGCGEAGSSQSWARAVCDSAMRPPARASHWTRCHAVIYIT